MPLFEIKENSLNPVAQANFPLEKDLQCLVEKNLTAIFNCRFIATEFPTGALHAGRIDTLALSEDNNPVIIEYKKVESSELINQSLYYLHWIQDHKGDFEIAVQKELGNNVEVDWSDVRVICIAPNYKKYDLHAVQVMGANIELWKYRMFKNSTFYLEEVFQANKVKASVQNDGKNPVMIEAGRKAAQVRATATYTFGEHVKGKSKKISELVYSIREYIINLDPAFEEVPKKYYIAYKISQNIVCMEIKGSTIKLFMKLDNDELESPPTIYRDVKNIGHYGTGNAEFTITSEKDFEETKPYVELAYNKVGS